MTNTGDKNHKRTGLDYYDLMNVVVRVELIINSFTVFDKTEDNTIIIIIQ